MPIIWEFRHGFQPVIHLNTLQFFVRAIKRPTSYLGYSLHIFPVKQFYTFKPVSDRCIFFQKSLCRISFFFRAVHLFKKVHETITHDFMPHITWVINVIEKLILGQYPSLFLTKSKLWRNCIFYADHGKLICFSNHIQPILQIPVICKYRKQQNDCRLIW